MRHRRIRLRLVDWFVAAIALSGATVGSAHHDRQPDATVRLGISVHKQQFLPREPVVLTVRVSNPTDEKKAVVLVRQGWNPRVSFTLQDGLGRTSSLDAPSAEYVGGPPIVTAETYQTTLLPPKSQVVYRQLFPDNQFARGTHTIQARLTEIPGLQNDRLESNIVTIDVTKPTGDEKTALALFEKRGDGDIRVEWYRSFIEEHPDSTYAPYARLILGRFHLSIGQYADAIQTLRELLETTPDFPLSLEVQHDIARANYRKGIKAFQDLIGQHPNWVGSHRAERVLLHGIDP